MLHRATLAFLKTEAGSGAILGLSALLALVWANSAASSVYFDLVGADLSLRLGGLTESHSVAGWIREGLMAIFFFVVGLEIKHEVLRGELADRRKLALPLLGAIGGMGVPAALYLLVNLAPGGDARGWSVPVATDIAFALAALAAVGRGLPASLRVLLLTLAIADDLGAVLVIAFAYSSAPQWAPLSGGLAMLVLMAALGMWRRAPPILWFLGFLVVWALVLRSGVSTSLAGVAAALTVPLGPSGAEDGPLARLMEALHPWTALLILPLFAFSAAGLDLSGLDLAALTPPTLGVALGLVLGKAIGVFAAAWLAVRLGLAARPAGASWSQLFGVALLCGIGFTMSLFIAALAFDDTAGLAAAKLGVLSGSAAAAVLGMGMLLLGRRRRQTSRH
jgi:NhaA family Na+:H+ antiporter